MLPFLLSWFLSFQQLQKCLKIICVFPCPEEKVELKRSFDLLITGKWLFSHNCLAFKCVENYFGITLHLRAIDSLLHHSLVARKGLLMFASCEQKWCLPCRGRSNSFLGDMYVCTYFLAKEWICSWGSSWNRHQPRLLSLCCSKAPGCQRSHVLGHRHGLKSPSILLCFAMCSAHTYGERGGRM